MDSCCESSSLLNGGFGFGEICTKFLENLQGRVEMSEEERLIGLGTWDFFPDESNLGSKKSAAQEHVAVDDCVDATSSNRLLAN